MSSFTAACPRGPTASRRSKSKRPGRLRADQVHAGRVVEVTEPHHRRVPRPRARRPRVPVAEARPRLPVHLRGHARELAARGEVRPILQRERLPGEPRGARREELPGLRSRLAVLQHLERARAAILRERHVDASQLQRRHLQAAHGRGQAVVAGIGPQALHAGQAQRAQEALHAEFLQQVHERQVERLGQRVLHPHQAQEAPVVVARRVAAVGLGDVRHEVLGQHQPRDRSPSRRAPA